MDVPRSMWVTILVVLVLAAVIAPVMIPFLLNRERERYVSMTLAEQQEHDDLSAKLRWYDEELERLRLGVPQDIPERQQERYERTLVQRRRVQEELDRRRRAMLPQVREEREDAGRRTSPMDRLVGTLVNEYAFVWWVALAFLGLRLPPSPGRKWVCWGLFLVGVAALTPWLARQRILEGEVGHTFRTWMTLAAFGLLVIGLIRFQPQGHGTRVGTTHTTNMTPRYYTTDELISRAAATPSANEDLEHIKVRWFEALTRFADEQPDQTALTGRDKYGRTILLERYVDMGTFEGRRCAQLRSVLIRFAGPGDNQPWMTATVEYSVDQSVVGRLTIPNEEVLRARQEPGRLDEFHRLRRFLETGQIRFRFGEGLGAALLGLGKAVAMIPVGIPLLVAGIAYAPIRAILGMFGPPRSRFVPTRCPETLPPERGGTPVGYWNALLPTLADCEAEVLKDVQNALATRAESGIRIYQKDVVQWGGYSLKEVRQQTVLEFHRAKVYVGVYRYGNDLYVRWDSHINRSTWGLHKFRHAQGVGYRFRKSWLAWAVPLFTHVPDVFEFAPSDSTTTDYDWADVDALQDLAHEILTDTVRRLKERYKIDKEIDFLMKGGERSGRGEQAEQREDKPARRGWRQRFARQQ